MRTLAQVMLQIRRQGLTKVASPRGDREAELWSGASDGDDDESPRKARPVQLKRRMNVRDAAQAAISEAHAQLVTNLSGLADEFEPVLVHQTRVALRRLRVFLRLFRAQVGKKEAERLANELRWLFVMLGALRDLQVFEQTYLPRVEAAAGAVATLHGRLQRRSELCRGELREALEGARFERLRRALVSLVAELAVPGTGHKHVRRRLARRLDRQHERALALEDVLHERQVADLHELRKRLKKLRYGVELMTGLYPHRKKRARRYLRRLRKLQDVLGRYMDQELARQVLGQLRAPAGLRQTLCEQLDQEAAAQLAELSVRLPRFAQVEPFWR